MKKMFHLKSLLVAVLSASVSFVFAAEGDQEGGEKKRPEGQGGRPGAGGGGGQFLERLDKNSDGKITKDEAPAEAWERLSKLDKNGDNAISKDELPAGRPGGGAGGPGGRPGGGDMLAAMFERMDADKDGKITQAEAGERWERMSRMDKNGDNALTKDELPQGRPGGGGDFFGQADKNSDGKITQEEAGERWERLSKADANNDGGVTKEELAAVMRDRAGQGGGQRPGRPGGDQAGQGGGQKPKRPPTDES